MDSLDSHDSQSNLHRNDQSNNPVLHVRNEGNSNVAVETVNDEDHINTEEQVEHERLVSQLLTMQDGFVPGDILKINNTQYSQHRYPFNQTNTSSLLNMHSTSKQYPDSSSNYDDQDEFMSEDTVNCINQLLNEIDQGQCPEDTNLNDRLGNYLLTSAEYANQSLVQKLLDRCNDIIHYTDSDGYTALHRAAGNHSGIKIVEMLIKRGANVSAETNDGWQPLHCACHWFHTDIASLLLQAGADINAKTGSGQTPLHLASRGQGEARSTIEMLLLNKVSLCDSRAINSCQESAEAIALRSGPNAALFELTDDSIKVSFKQFRLSKTS
ncbi:Ankyrin repeat domain-containing protein 49 [Trichoplax sp. H2]|nr:Ankyrin repeat domain-containing protein 49 [Trichoplax sp. H2]|eukprot:RDD44041.1 Ankyrin repeat domain-containing protein 49 [Trichoplax sp. H2]